MKFIKVPNLPHNPVGLVVIDGRTDNRIEQSLAERNIKVLRTSAHAGVYNAISCHPDIMLHHLGEEYIVYAPGTCEHILEQLRKLGFTLIEGERKLGSNYPDDIPYNVARVGKYAFHNFKHTDPVLVHELLRRGVKLVNVKQGYSKCSISIVSEKAIITADKGIAKAAEENGIAVLLIASDEGIVLPGLSCGFIGGSTGLLDRGKWAITGDLMTLSSAHKVRDFLALFEVETLSLLTEKIKDIGSILSLCEL